MKTKLELRESNPVSLKALVLQTSPALRLWRVPILNHFGFLLLLFNRLLYYLFRRIIFSHVDVNAEYSHDETFAIGVFTKHPYPLRDCPERIMFRTNKRNVYFHGGRQSNRNPYQLVVVLIFKISCAPCTIPSIEHTERVELSTEVLQTSANPLGLVCF